MPKSNFGNVLNQISNLRTTNYDKTNYIAKKNNLFSHEANLLDFLKQEPSYNEPEKFALQKNDYSNQQQNFYNSNDIMKTNGLLHPA